MRSERPVSQRHGVGAAEWLAGHAEHVAALGELPGAMPIAEQTVIANAMESGREDVQEEAPDKLGGLEGHRLVRLWAGCPVVLIAKRHAPVVEVEEPLV